MSSYSSFTYPIEKEFKAKQNDFFSHCIFWDFSLQKIKLLKQLAKQKTDKVDQYIKLKKGFEEAKTIEDKKKVIQLYNKVAPVNILNQFSHFIYFENIKIETDAERRFLKLTKFFFQDTITDKATELYIKYIKNGYMDFETFGYLHTFLDRTCEWITKESRIHYFPETLTTAIETLDRYLIPDLADIVLNYA